MKKTVCFLLCAILLFSAAACAENIPPQPAATPAPFAELATLCPTPDPPATPSPKPLDSLAPEPRFYPAPALSSFGYVSEISVNLREAPDVNSRRIRKLRQYAFCLILGTERNNDDLWYRIYFDETEGYVIGTHFTQLPIHELVPFLLSDRYQEGISNNP